MKADLGAIKSQLGCLQGEAKAALAQAGDLTELEQLRVKYLGRKGALTEVLKGVGRLPANERPLAGRYANEAKADIERAIEARQHTLKSEQGSLRIEAERVDVTLPGRRSRRGWFHPIHLGLSEITGIFTAMGFDLAEGPEIEDEFHNFDALNIPPEHPARAMHDTFFVAGDDGLLLRTHTSPVQIRTMLAGQPPLAVVAAGRVYRCDHDVSHSPMFHQVEVFLVDRHVSMAQLKGVLRHFLSSFFGRDVPLRLRPSYFPFTEPSAEVDIGCVLCQGAGCRVCKDSGWLEVLGAGMIHPHVLQAVDIDPEGWSGFAFGLGVERLVMLKYGIPDLRLLFDNDVRMLAEIGA